jgi:hypothetical protein
MRRPARSCRLAIAVAFVAAMATVVTVLPAASRQEVYGDVRVILMAGLSRPLPVPLPPRAGVRHRRR